MGRPKKIGLDFFMLDTTPNWQWEALDSIHGNDGVAWYIRFLQEAYKTECGTVQIGGFFGEILAKKSHISTQKQREIIDFCLLPSVGLLVSDGDDVITSHGVRRRIAAISSDRASAIDRHERRKEAKEEESNSKSNSIVEGFGDISPKNPDCSPKNPKIFIKPTIDEIKTYCSERKNDVDPEKWLSHYESNGWMVGKNKMKDWKAAVRTWEKNDFKTLSTNTNTLSPCTDEYTAALDRACGQRLR